MNIKKKLLSLFAVVLSFSYTFPSVVAASNITDAAYTAGIRVNNAATETIVNATALLQLDAEILKDQYYTNSSLTGVAMRDANNHDIYFMPPVSSESIDWTVYVPSIIPGNEDWKMYLSQENMNPSISLFPGPNGVQAVTSSTLNIGPDTTSWDVELNGIVIKDNTEDPLLTVGNTNIYINGIDIISNLPADTFNAVASNDNFLVLIASNNRLCVTSGGTSYHYYTIPITANWNSICADTNNFYIVAKGSNVCLKTNDFVNYTDISLPAAFDNNTAIYYGGGTFVYTNKSNLYVSANAVDWTSISGSNWLIAYNNNYMGLYSTGDGYFYIFQNGSQKTYKAITIDRNYARLVATNDGIYAYASDNIGGFQTTNYKKEVYYYNGSEFTTTYSNTSTSKGNERDREQVVSTGGYSFYINNNKTVNYSNNAQTFQSFTTPITANFINFFKGRFYIISNNLASGSYYSETFNNFVNGGVVSFTQKLIGPNVNIKYENRAIIIVDNDIVKYTYNDYPLRQSLNYQFTSSATTIKVDNIKIKVNDETVADWSWHPDGVLLDASGNGNNATTDYAVAYDPNITLSIQSIVPIKVSAAEDGGDDSGGISIIDPEDGPVVIPDVETQNWDKIPLFKDLAKDIRNEDWPVDLVLSMAVVLLDMIICFVLYKFTRNQLTSGVIAIVFLGYFTVMGCIPIFALVVSIIAELAVMTKRKVISY